VLKQFESIERIGVMFSSHSESIPLFFNNKPLFEKNKTTDENFDFMQSILCEFNVKHIDFLACNTLQYESWQSYYSKLSKETQVVVGASENKTGNLKYGGDWVMESTKENVEQTYFTKGIEYYMYLLDNEFYTFIVSELTLPWGIAIAGDYLYFSQIYDGITKVDLRDGTVVEPDWANTGGASFGLTISGNFLYASDVESATIAKIELSTGTVVDPNWATGLYQMGYTIFAHEGFIYIANTENNTISKIDITSGTVVEPNWVTGLNYPYEMVVQNGIMYVSNWGDSSISKIDLATGAILQLNWVIFNEIVGVVGLVIQNNIMYAMGSFVNGFYKINMSNGAILSFEPTDIGLITSMKPYNSSLYISVLNAGFIGKLKFTLPIPPPSRTRPLVNMQSLFSNNAQVYYKAHSLASCGVGSVGNSRLKSKKT
jgi:hypothetical protein